MLKGNITPIGFDSPEVEHGLFNTEQNLRGVDSSKEYDPIENEYNQIEKAYRFMMFIDRLTKLDSKNQDKTIRGLENISNNCANYPALQVLIMLVIEKIRGGYIDFSVILSELTYDVLAVDIKDSEIISFVNWCRNTGPNIWKEEDWTLIIGNIMKRLSNKKIELKGKLLADDALGDA